MTNQALADYNQSHFSQCHGVAMRQRKAVPSDPFTYNRVMAHLLNGICMISDYAVDFRKEGRVTANGAHYSVDVPHNMKIGG